jgi:hypothetical protein
MLLIPRWEEILPALWESLLPGDDLPACLTNYENLPN